MFYGFPDILFGSQWIYFSHCPTGLMLPITIAYCPRSGNFVKLPFRSEASHHHRRPAGVGSSVVRDVQFPTAVPFSMGAITSMLLRTNLTKWISRLTYNVNLSIHRKKFVLSNEIEKWCTPDGKFSAIPFPLVSGQDKEKVQLGQNYFARLPTACLRWAVSLQSKAYLGLTGIVYQTRRRRRRPEDPQSDSVRTMSDTA